MRCRRWRDEGYLLTGGDDRAQGRTQEAPLKHRRLRAQNIGDRLTGPAATGQFTVEVWKAGREDSAIAMPELGATPDCRRHLR